MGLLEEIDFEIPTKIMREFSILADKKYGKTAEELIIEFVKWSVNNPEEAKSWLLETVG